jgi:peptide/nickel transport system permease protein
MHPVLKAVLQRLSIWIASLLGVSVVVYALAGLLPETFAADFLGAAAKPEAMARFDSRIEHPAAANYPGWLAGVLRGDFGSPYASGDVPVEPVAAIIAPRLRNSLALAGIAVLIAVPLALVLGAAAASGPGGWAERLTAGVAGIVNVSPVFLIAYATALLFSVWLGWFAPLATVTQDMSPGAWIARVALPVLTLIGLIAGPLSRSIRFEIAMLMASPYVQAAKLRGVRPDRIAKRYALPNAWSPVVRAIAWSLIGALPGLVVVESVFAYPGLGHLLVEAASARNIPVVQACVLIFASLIVLLHIATDLVEIANDPRLRHQR